MARRILLLALAISVSAFAARAAEYATFILNSGERVSGTLASPRNTSETLVAGMFNLVVAGAGAEQFSYDQVAVIDFAGGWPRASELSALPLRDQMMAMRNGGIRMGHFINIVNGDRVRWQEAGGSIREFHARQVARIYLNPDAARQIYGAADQSGGYAGDPYGGYTVPRSSSAYPRAQGYDRVVVDRMIVPANVAWSDTGLNVTRGESLRFESQGQIAFIQGPNNMTGTAGRAEIRNDRYPVRWLGVGALIGKVGVNGIPFAIGGSTAPIAMPAAGRLFLGVNDDELADNDGAFEVTIARTR